MAYATSKDLAYRFGSDAIDRLGDSTEQVNALNDASAQIDGYLGGRYTLPLANPPAVLVGLCCDIARYLLHDINVPEAVKDRYTHAIDMLNKYGSGALQLMPPDDDSASSANLAEFESASVLFSRNDSGDFI